MSTAMRQTLRLLRVSKLGRAGLRLNSTDSKILTSVYKDIGYNHSNVNDFVWQNLDQWPDKTATVSKPDSNTQTICCLGLFEYN